MKKRYNLVLKDVDTGETVHEIELKINRIRNMGAFIDNLVHITFVEFENAIDNHEGRDNDG